MKLYARLLFVLCCACSASSAYALTWKNEQNYPAIDLSASNRTLAVTCMAPGAVSLEYHQAKGDNPFPYLCPVKGMGESLVTIMMNTGTYGLRVLGSDYALILRVEGDKNPAELKAEFLNALAGATDITFYSPDFCRKYTHFRPIRNPQKVREFTESCQEKGPVRP